MHPILVTVLLVAFSFLASFYRKLYSVRRYSFECNKRVL